MHRLEPGKMAGVRAVAETGASWRETGSVDTESRESGEAKEVWSVLGKGARWRRTEVVEVGLETRTGSVGSWEGAGEDRTRVSEAHGSEVVAERAGTGAGKKGVARG